MSSASLRRSSVAAYLPNREHSRKVQALLYFLEQQIVSVPAS